MKYGIIILCTAAAAMLIPICRMIFNALVDKRISEYQNDLINKQCEEVENMYRQMRGWRHDYKHHIQTMKAHVAMGQFQELEGYLNELDSDLTAVETVIKSGNVRIDAVLNSKLALAKARGIAVNAKAMVPKELAIGEVDLCVIIGNLLDNAIEACVKCEDREKQFIRVYIDILKKQLYIYVSNSMADDIRVQGGRYLSTKIGANKKGYHGFGLMRADRVVKKYGGYLNRQHEEGVFATEIMLPL